LSISTIIQEIVNELKSANQKFPPFNSSHEGLAILREEYLETEQAIFHETSQRAREEAIQVAAMAVKLIRCIDGEGRI
jgi:hypothetical protein